MKEKIEAEHKMAGDMMKLIAYGKVMDDDAKTLKEYSIKEGDFLVVMVSKVFQIIGNLYSYLGKTSSKGKTRGRKERRNWICFTAIIDHHCNHFIKQSTTRCINITIKPTTISISLGTSPTSRRSY